VSKYCFEHVTEGGFPKYKHRFRSVSTPVEKVVYTCSNFSPNERNAAC
jgi:hypothetical protein